eukprot:PhM_4_TR1312/c0_g1_i2/m.52757/K05673/ABCC4; ATP-binding cassette, subfamily C (CFTR/MRP), member 4
MPPPSEGESLTELKVNPINHNGTPNEPFSEANDGGNDTVHITLNKSQAPALSSPLEDAGWFSKFLFLWTIPIMATGASKVLESSDVPPIPTDERAHVVHRNVCAAWDDEVKKRGLEKASFFRALWRVYGFRYIMYGLVVLFEGVIMMGIPLILARVVRYLEDDKGEYSEWEGYTWAAVLVIANIVLAIVHHHNFFFLWRQGARVRSAIQVMVYEKAIHLDGATLSHITTGRIMNVIGTDIVRIEDWVIFPNFLWVTVLVVAFTCYMLVHYVGYTAGFVGTGCIVTLVPLQMSATTYFSTLKGRLNGHRDQRIKHVHEIVHAMRIVKMYSWEEAFAEAINALRGREVNEILKINILQALVLVLLYSSPVLIALVTFSTFVALDGELTAEIAYGTMAIIYPARMWAANFAPLAMRAIVEVSIIFQRVENILHSCNKKEYRNRGSRATDVDGTPELGITVSNVSGKWEPTSPFSLQDVSFHVNPGEVVALVGKVGSGKSSILECLLGEFTPQSGGVHISGKIAYASQVPWMMNDTVRNNIVFNRPWDRAWYRKVVAACSLSRDFKLWTEADQTLIGERGVTLSGGQRARIGL